jgi:hypothetical protein
VYPVAIHSAWSNEAPSSAWMVGMATLTMLVSSTAMKLPIITTLSGSSHPRSGAWPAAGATAVRERGRGRRGGCRRRTGGAGRRVGEGGAVPLRGALMAARLPGPPRR